MPATRSTQRARTSSSGKRATNLSLSSDVLEAARQLDINISQVCDSYLRELVRREQEAHRAPRDLLEPLAVQQMDDERP